MTNDAKPTVTPKLRFPEFQDSPGWKEKPIREAVSQVVRQKQKPHVPYVGLGLRSHGKGTFIKVNEDPKKNTMDVLYEVKRDDLIVNITFAWEGAIAIAKPEDEGALVSHRFPTYTFETNVAVPEFFQFIICTKKFVYDLGVISPGGAGRNRVLNKNDFLKLGTLLPGVDEQQKIAVCLSTLDDLIGAECQKLDALKAHKKGLMQQLFPREGETLPRLRFREFQNSEEWVRKPFAELCDIKHGYAFEGEFFSNEGDYVLLTPGNFYEEGGYRDRGEKQKYYTGEIPRDYVLNCGDLLVAMTEQAAGLLGSPILVPESAKFLHNQRLGLVTKRPGVAWTNEFFFYVFNSQPVRQAIHASASGAKVSHTSPKKIGEVVVSFPASLPEQHRIATCLFSLDELITAQSDRLSALKAHKQGLMQQLFPLETVA